MMREVTVTVVRGTADARFEQSYVVPLGEAFSVMDVLDFIYIHLDPTLAFFNHEACRQTACGKCLVKINGKMGLACGVQAEPGALRLEPWNGRVVRDLICEGAK